MHSLQFLWRVQELHKIKDPGSPEVMRGQTCAKEPGLACVCGHGVGAYGEAENLEEGANRLHLWAL